MGFETPILDQAIKERRQRWEQERQVVLERLLGLLDDLAAQFDLHQAYIFGSLAQQGRFTSRSDVDAAVVNLPSEQFFTVSARLSAALGRDVDLIELDKCHFADKIRREGLLWTAPD